MKRTLAAIFLCAIASVTAAAQLNFVHGNTIDLDTITQGEKACGSILIRNDGSEPLAIVNVFAECGCTVPEYSRKPIAPGDSSVIKVTFDSKGRAYGHFTKAVRIRTDSGATCPFLVKGIIRKVYRK